MEQNEIKRSEEYIAQRDRLFYIYYYTYILARLDLPSDLTDRQRKKKIKKSRKELNKKIQSLIVKWKELTKAECGEPYSLKGVKIAASIEGGKQMKRTDKDVLRKECEEKLAIIMPRPKRKRITAVKVGR